MSADQVLKKDKHICVSVLQVLYIVFAKIMEKTFQEIELPYIFIYSLLYLFIVIFIIYRYYILPYLSYLHIFFSKTGIVDCIISSFK